MLGASNYNNKQTDTAVFNTRSNKHYFEKEKTASIYDKPIITYNENNLPMFCTEKVQYENKMTHSV